MCRSWDEHCIRESAKAATHWVNTTFKTHQLGWSMAPSRKWVGVVGWSFRSDTMRKIKEGFHLPKTIFEGRQGLWSPLHLQPCILFSAREATSNSFICCHSEGRVESSGKAEGFTERMLIEICKTQNVFSLSFSVLHLWCEIMNRSYLMLFCHSWRCYKRKTCFQYCMHCMYMLIAAN